MALGREGEEIVEKGEDIRSELSHRWTKIMTEGLTKEQKEALVRKYPTPNNFQSAVAPILNKEIAVVLSDLSINRDKRIIARQNMLGKLMSALGKSLTDILQGNINTKKLIEEINDAAKIAAEIYHTDNKSRKFFALSTVEKSVQDACKDTKTEKYLFGDNLSEQLKAMQAVKRSAAQIKGTNKPTPTITRPLNVRGPSQHQPASQYHSASQRGRGGQRMRRPAPNQPPHRTAPPRRNMKPPPRKTNQRRY